MLLFIFKYIFYFLQQPVRRVCHYFPNPNVSSMHPCLSLRIALWMPLFYSSPHYSWCPSPLSPSLTTTTYYQLLCFHILLYLCLAFDLLPLSWLRILSWNLKVIMNMFHPFFSSGTWYSLTVLNKLHSLLHLLNFPIFWSSSTLISD